MNNRPCDHDLSSCTHISCMLSSLVANSTIKTKTKDDESDLRELAEWMN